ncbi:MAG TPA: acyl-ACP--UDP-N-acetylglucosamine O-acyltransferase [Gemmatimonadaceae bacterium]|jgi:UDP-N-acetylglucosamine acyltransferase|nr:acyl-ACP--UDP-N-acetylglucosamine O-acyltransferase [Gemmatimonadaceae bacterium]
MKKSGIHPTAIVSPKAEIGSRVEIGPFVIVGEGCEIGDDCQLHPRATLERDVKLAPRVKVGIGSVLGGAPQDLKYAGEPTTVEIGADTVIREFVTINRGTSQSFKTTVGEKCLLMSYVHLAHDCHIGNGVILGNSVQLAGHVIIEDKVTFSGLSGAHQFVRIGRNAFIGGCSRVSKDIPPFLKAVGNPIKLYGLNSVGLQRNGFSDEVVRELKRAYRLFFRSDFNVSQAMRAAETELEMYPEVRELMRFVEASGRGVVI